MNRTHFGLTSARMALLGLPWLLVACGGKLPTEGGNPDNGSGTGSSNSPSGGGSNTPTEVAPSSVSGAVAACPVGSAHPNVCCSATSTGTASCVAYGAPFQACPTGSSTYPDPSQCCSLDDTSSCGGGSSGGSTTSPPTGCSCPAGETSCVCEADAGVTPPGTACACPDNDPDCSCFTDAGINLPPICSCPDGENDCACGVDAGPPTISCTYACPPGWYAPPDSPGTCCMNDGNEGACTGQVTACPPPVCNGEGACSTPACAAPEPSCPACPAGWQAPEGSPDLCCRTDGSGLIECFSQATGPAGGGSGVSFGGGSSTGSADAGSTLAFDGSAGPVPGTSH